MEDPDWRLVIVALGAVLIILGGLALIDIYYSTAVSRSLLEQ